MLTPDQWLQKATIFELGTCPIHARPVKIEERRNAHNGEIKWCVKMHEWCLGKDAEWYWEPTSSNRSEEFVNNTRFDTPDEAHTFWIENVKQFKPLFVG